MDINRFNEFGLDLAKGYAKEFAPTYFEMMETVLENAINHPETLPNFSRSKISTLVFKDYIKDWVSKFSKGYNNRPSIRTGNKSGTIPDPLVTEALVAFLKEDESSEKIQNMTEGHRLMMRIENLMGDFLEEYLSVKLTKYGWSCCWGSTMSAIDFCNKQGTLLQIKNSDNSENSSSSKIRAGTKIIIWARRNSKKKNSFNWAELNADLGINDLSEVDYRKFVTEKIQANPQCLMID